jgi:hypothetical protein
MMRKVHDLFPCVKRLFAHDASTIQVLAHLYAPIPAPDTTNKVNPSVNRIMFHSPSSP